VEESVLSLDEAIANAATGDVWLFRGKSMADRAIQAVTNSPINHVGMAVVLDDLPPLMWHAELGRSLPDVWAGTHHRGVQLHVLRDAVLTWGRRYGQQAWLRQLHHPDGELTREQEDALLRTIARLDGTPFPSMARLAGRWLRGRLPARRRRGDSPTDGARESSAGEGGAGEGGAPEDGTFESAYCAEVVAVTYEDMGLLPPDRRAHWYDPGRFWSGDGLTLRDGYALGREIAVTLPPD
jgi:hypothetical protein